MEYLLPINFVALILITIGKHKPIYKNIWEWCILRAIFYGSFIGIFIGYSEIFK